MNNNQILIDMDGVIADFEKGFLQNWRKKYPTSPYVPLNKRSTFYIMEDYPNELRDQVQGIYLEKGFIASLPEVKGAINALNEMATAGFKIKICTSPLSNYKNCVEEKYEWVDKHLGHDWTKDIILVKDKTQVLGMTLIDDRPEIRGEFEGVWEHVIFDRPYNKHIINKRRLSNWASWKELFSIPNQPN